MQTTILTKSMFKPSQLMAVTGHALVQSLTVYQRTDIEEKIAMGHTMGKSFSPNRELQYHTVSSSLNDSLGLCHKLVHKG
jgi:hypothetical protein